MKFIVDAQLPKSLSNFRCSTGHDSVHTLDLPLQNKTSDVLVNLRAKQEQSVVITKDNYFLETYLVNNIPEKLVLVKTGNISNNELLRIFEMQMEKICIHLESSNLIVIYKTGIVVH